MSFRELLNTHTGIFFYACTALAVWLALLSSPNSYRAPTPDILQPYSMHILLYDPLMIYLENFITKAEREHLLSLGNSSFQRSEVSAGVSDWRTSSTAYLPDDDIIVKSIISRASEFQGYTSLIDHETLQLTRYEPGQYYKPHHDHMQDTAGRENEIQRMTTIFATVEASCSDCGTRFPDLAIDWSKEDPAWCQFVDCADMDGITIRPIPGNALFWKNLNSDGLGESKTLHAGLPPSTGVKTGLNIWTWVPRLTKDK